VETALGLIALGYTNVLHYKGGKKDWIAASLPVSRHAIRTASE
jgi:rhodanese-related sulfurtransferase